MAAIATQTIEVDLTPGGVSPFLYVSQGDYGTRSLVFNFFLNGQPYSIPSNVTTISLDGITKAGNAFSVPCSFNPGETTATSSLTADMTADVGMDICEIAFKTDVGERLGTANFFIVVEISPLGIKVLYGNVYWSELSKSYAIGDTGIRANEDTDNSEYYHRLSKSYAIGNTGLREDEDTENSKHYYELISDTRSMMVSYYNELANLQAQINQYLNPPTENVGEVVNARIGYDGTIYPNLGVAIRTQLTKFGYVVENEEIYFVNNE